MRIDKICAFEFDVRNHNGEEDSSQPRNRQPHPTESGLGVRWNVPHLGVSTFRGGFSYFRTMGEWVGNGFSQRYQEFLIFLDPLRKSNEFSTVWRTFQ
jgi:hypothetical protein